MQEPGARVASIYELLEMIMIDLPLKDLLELRTIGKHFKNVVDTSQQIALRFCLPFSRQLRTVDHARHPLLPKEVDIWTGRRAVGGYVVCRFVLRAGGKFDWTAAASWKNFYACRPETRSMRAWSGCSKVFGSSSMGEYRFYRSQRGVTLGQLADAACAMRQSADVDEAIVHFETDLDDNGADVAKEQSSTYTEYWL
ncbi:hypothetical protein CERZMDRAFT_93866 [Cercospora zeae-maydis SCOH1-5]|uniref:F-box domain-containing protein n=1 Tax=Cercospora zeae-maydis SCOH1-5 TaxID=717836 RepID=A0A6A6FSV7_9PEZI|nr:hypothetical protein CERZMDRAFT_93866 [Cercospora zeae-maydis SCOH1-5]